VFIRGNEGCWIQVRSFAQQNSILNTASGVETAACGVETAACGVETASGPAAALRSSGRFRPAIAVTPPLFNRPSPGNRRCPYSEEQTRYSEEYAPYSGEYAPYSEEYARYSEE
jgi:hypothetical protein